MKKTALISTGTDISDNDLKNIQELATQVLDLAAYRVQLLGAEKALFQIGRAHV